MASTSKSGGDTTLPNIQEIQNTLWEQVQNLRSGKTSPASANAVSNAVGKIFTGVKLQIEFYRMTGATPNIPFLLTAP